MELISGTGDLTAFLQPEPFLEKLLTYVRSLANSSSTKVVDTWVNEMIRDRLASNEPATSRPLSGKILCCDHHSYRKESVGLTLDARRAGTKLAKRTTEARRMDTLASVATSNGLTP
jgi:hypothetical protein